MMVEWYRRKDLLIYAATKQSWDISHWTDEDYNDFMRHTFSDQVGQVEQMEQVGTK